MLFVNPRRYYRPHSFRSLLECYNGEKYRDSSSRIMFGIRHRLLTGSSAAARPVCDNRHRASTAYTAAAGTESERLTFVIVVTLPWSATVVHSPVQTKRKYAVLHGERNENTRSCTVNEKRRRLSARCMETAEEICVIRRNPSLITRETSGCRGNEGLAVQRRRR